MMQFMHRLSKSWAASLLMGALALSFVVWGIADVFTGMSSTALATVGSTEIRADSFQRTYRNFVRNQSQQMGMDISPEMAQRMNLGNVALQQLLSRTALDNAVSRLKLTTSDAVLAQNVRAMQAFRGASGSFDHDAFLRVIQNAGYTEQDFLNEMRSDMTRQQLTDALQTGFVVPAAYAQAIFLYLTEKRAAEYVIVSPDSVGPIAPPADAVLAAYVKSYPGRFSTPEYRQVEYARISPKDLADKVSITDAMVARTYDAQKAQYQVPEKRDVQQIEFPAEADARAARAALEKGMTFETLAAERKISPQSLSLGVLTKADLPDPARAEAAFSLPVNTVSQPVKGALSGYVLLRVTAITPGVSRSLDDVKAQIRSSLALQAAGGKLIDIVNAFEDARSGGADIAAAARKTGMTYGKLVAVDKNGLAPDGSKTDAPGDPEFLAQVFAAEVGEDSDPFPAKSGDNYAIKVIGVTPPRLKSLDTVRAEALAGWSDEQRQAALRRKAADLTARARADKGLTAIARDLKVPVQNSPALGRDTSDTTFSAALVAKIFAAAPGGVVEGEQGRNFLIARVTGIAHAPATGQLFEGGRQQLSAQAATDFSVSFANAARLQQGVRVNQQMLQSALGQQ